MPDQFKGGDSQIKKSRKPSGFQLFCLLTLGNYFGTKTSNENLKFGNPSPLGAVNHRLETEDFQLYLD